MWVPSPRRGDASSVSSAGVRSTGPYSDTASPHLLRDKEVVTLPSLVSSANKSSKSPKMLVDNVHITLQSYVIG